MASIEQILVNEIESGRTPSVQYYLFDKDQILKSFVSGYADIGNKKKVDAGTTYHAFSVTKTFTALAILQYAENRQIEINKPVIHYLPEFSYNREITIRQILSHTAGIPNPIPLSWIHLESEHEGFDRNSFFKKIIEKHATVRSGPNEKFAYSNLGYVILGQLLEKISGQTYETCISQNIISRLSLNTGDLGFEPMNKSEHAKGYQKNWSFTNFILGLFINKPRFMGSAEGTWKPFHFYYVNGPSYGGLIGRPKAFVKYVQELLSDNNKLISSEYKKALFRENQNNKGENTGMCLSWFKGELGGEEYYSHAGGGGGYYSEIRLYPRLGIGSVVFFNRTGMRDERFLDKPDIIYLDNQTGKS